MKSRLFLSHCKRCVPSFFHKADVGGDDHGARQHPGERINQHEPMETRPNGADGEDPHHAEQAGADNREEGGKERTPHSAQG